MPRVFHTGVGFLCPTLPFLPFCWMAGKQFTLPFRNKRKKNKQHNLALIQSEEPGVTMETDVEFTLVLFLKTKTSAIRFM